MASSGLSRRRVAGVSSSLHEDDAEGIWPNGNGASMASSVNNLPKLSHAGSAFEGGSKVAYDPHELERESEEARVGGKLPKLTIMEEVLLLGLKDKQVVNLTTGATSLINNSSRGTFHFGMIIYHMHYEDAYCLNLLFDGEYVF